MIDQSRITSGFDLELLLSERYIKYFLLASFETGSMPWYMQDIDPDTGDITTIMIHPPVELQENRLYIPLDFDAHPFLDEVPVVYTNLATACEVQLLPDDQEADVRVTLIISIIAAVRRWIRQQEKFGVHGQFHPVYRRSGRADVCDRLRLEYTIVRLAVGRNGAAQLPVVEPCDSCIVGGVGCEGPGREAIPGRNRK